MGFIVHIKGLNASGVCWRVKITLRHSDMLCACVRKLMLRYDKF